jgi:hypothetical protein
MESEKPAAGRRPSLPAVMVFVGLGIVFATWSTGSVYHADTFDRDRPAVEFLDLFGMSFSGVSNRTGSLIIFGLLGFGLAVFGTGVALSIKRHRRT